MYPLGWLKHGRVDLRGVPPKLEPDRPAVIIAPLAPAVGDQRHQAQSPAVFGGRVESARGRSRGRPLISDGNADPRLTLLDDDLKLAFVTRRRVQQGVGSQLGHAQDCLVGDRAACQCPCHEPPGVGHLLVAARKHPSLCPRDRSLFPCRRGRALGCLCQFACRCPVGAHEAPISPRWDPPPDGQSSPDSAHGPKFAHPASATHYPPLSRDGIGSHRVTPYLRSGTP